MYRPARIKLCRTIVAGLGPLTIDRVLRLRVIYHEAYYATLPGVVSFCGTAFADIANYLANVNPASFASIRVVGHHDLELPSKGCYLSS
jgi:hypothetical protein